MSAEPFSETIIEHGGGRATLAGAHLKALCAGHFPGNPIVPGAYVAGLMAELGARLLASSGERPRLVEVERCAFLAPLHPEAEVVMTATAPRGRDGGLCVDTEVYADGRCVARGRFRFA